MMVIINSNSFQQHYYLCLNHIRSIIAHLHHIAVDVYDVTGPDVLHQIVHGNKGTGAAHPRTFKNI